MNKVVGYLKQILTEMDNQTFSATKLVFLSGAATMIGEFLRLGSSDYTSLGVGLSVLMAANAGKYYFEGKDHAIKEG